MRKLAVWGSVGLFVAVGTLGACGGDAEVPPVDEAPLAEAPVSAGPEAPPAAPGGAEPAPGAVPAGATPEMVEAGRQVFVGQGLCFTCHGQDAAGTPLAPSLVDDQWLNIESPQVDLQPKLETLVRTGVAQPQEHPAPMPPMGGAQLTDEQVDAVVAYVMSLHS